jgi:hypothetical protein
MSDVVEEGTRAAIAALGHMVRSRATELTTTMHLN